MLSSIRFAGDLSPWLVIVVAIASAATVAWLYLRESRTVAAPFNYLLPALRASAVAMVILILAGPVWHRRITVGTLGRVVFAVDSSRSMGVTDSQTDQSSPNRLNRALRMLSGDSGNPGFLESLKSTHDVDVIAFNSGSPSLVWSSDDGESGTSSDFEAALVIEAEGNRTDLSAPLAMLMAESDLASNQDATASDSVLSRSALVIISDGRDNSGDSAVDLAGPLKAAGAEIHSIGMGSKAEPPDVAIVQVDRPESVAVDGKLAGAINLNQFGMDGREFTLRIESGDGSDTFWQQNVKASASNQQTVPFELDVKSIVSKIDGDSPRGVRRSTVVMDLRAVVEPVEGDTSVENNRMPFRVAASTRDRRLLILDGSSRWETRYIRNLFERDPAWSVDTLLYGPGTDMPRIRRGIEAGQFPQTREAFARYDAVVLGEVPPDQFETADADLLRDFVTRGGGLIVIDGRYDRVHQVANKMLGDLVPVRFLDPTPTIVRALIPTRMGFEHPALNLGGDKADLEKLWSQLPAPMTAVQVEVQEGAEVWADVITIDNQRSPWLVTRLFGAGRVFYLSSDQTWRWRYKVADRIHARFWNQIFAAAMQPPYSASDDYVAMGTDKIEYAEGTSAIIRARLQDSTGSPIGDATVDALLIANNQIVGTVPLAIDDPARGTYQAVTGALEAGAYQIRIRASGFDTEALQASTPIWVGTSDTTELNRVSLNENSLVQIADAGDGVYLHESESAKILDRLRPLSAGTIVESDVLVWQSYYWFWAVVLILGIEWFLRKRAGLV